MASVDVVVPCYNYARYLHRCIDSILGQEGVDVRALIIDDASTDDTPSVGPELARHDPRVEYRRHATNLRHIATYNEGLLEWAAADYSLLLSADDLLAPGALRRATHVMDARRDVHMTYGMALLFFDDAEIADYPENANIDPPEPAGYRLVPGPDFIRRAILGNPVPTPAAVVRTEMQRRLGGYSATLPHTADLEMWMRFAAYGSIGVVPFVQAYKRMHATNMSINYYDRPLGDFRERIDACREVLTRHASKMDGAKAMLEHARQELAQQVFWSASRMLDEGELKACQQALDFAVELWPPVRTTLAWQRLRLKRALPRGLWRKFQPALDVLRGLPQDHRIGAGNKPQWSSRQQIGWWPGSPSGSDVASDVHSAA